MEARCSTSASGTKPGSFCNSLPGSVFCFFFFLALWVWFSTHPDRNPCWPRSNQTRTATRSRPHRGHRGTDCQERGLLLQALRNNCRAPVLEADRQRCLSKNESVFLGTSRTAPKKGNLPGHARSWVFGETKDNSTSQGFKMDPFFFWLVFDREHKDASFVLKLWDLYFEKLPIYGREFHWETLWWTSDNHLGSPLKS